MTASANPMAIQGWPTLFTLEEYSALERACERRFELREGEVVCMSGGSREHAAIASNLVRHLGSKFARGCRVYGSDLAVYVPAGLPYRYPNASVVCGKPRVREINGLEALEHPVV